MPQLFGQFNFGNARKRRRRFRRRVGVMEYFDHTSAYAYRVPAEKWALKQRNPQKERF